MSRSLRLAKILRVVGRYRLDELIDQQRLPALPRTALRLSPWRLFTSPDMSQGERLRRALEELGPVFIKFGQMLSTRRDLLPEDIADELAKLQDDVPPFPQEQSIAIIEKALGKPISALYAEFEATPMASASVAQVHRATLHSGEHVVVSQITGLIARRIVCHPEVGEWLDRGVRYGLIRFGSRTDVVLPESAELRTRRGERVHGGSTVIAQLPRD